MPLMPRMPSAPMPRVPRPPTGASLRMTGVRMEGWDRVKGAVSRLQAAGARPSRVFRLIGRRLRAMQMRHFQDERDSRGEDWPRLRDSTIKARRKGPHPGRGRMRKLRDTGRLAGSLMTRTSDTEAVVGTNVVYAATHQFGDKKRNIPKREFLYINDEEKRALTDMLNNELIVEALRC